MLHEDAACGDAETETDHQAARSKRRRPLTAGSRAEMDCTVRPVELPPINAIINYAEKTRLRCSQRLTLSRNATLHSLFIIGLYCITVYRSKR